MSFFFCLDVHVEHHKKQLHVTLAYHFQTSHLTILEKMAKEIDVSSGCDWLAVLFSRDIRFANHEVCCFLLVYYNKVLKNVLHLKDSMFSHVSCIRTLHPDSSSYVPVRASE